MLTNVLEQPGAQSGNYGWSRSFQALATSAASIELQQSYRLQRRRTAPGEDNPWARPQTASGDYGLEGSLFKREVATRRITSVEAQPFLDATQRRGEQPDFGLLTKLLAGRERIETSPIQWDVPGTSHQEERREAWIEYLRHVAGSTQPPAGRVIERLTELAKEEDGWCGRGSAAPKASAIADAARFAALLPAGAPQPLVSAADDGEVVFDWMLPEGRRAIASFEGDGEVAYALLEGTLFQPGADTDLTIASSIPAKLEAYLRLGEDNS